MNIALKWPDSADYEALEIQQFDRNLPKSHCWADLDRVLTFWISHFSKQGQPFDHNKLSSLSIFVKNDSFWKFTTSICLGMVTGDSRTCNFYNRKSPARVPPREFPSNHHNLSTFDVKFPTAAGPASACTSGTPAPRSRIPAKSVVNKTHTKRYFTLSNPTPNAKL